MGKRSSEIMIEQCEVYHEGQMCPNIYYNIFTGSEQLCEASIDDLLTIRDLINQIEESTKTIVENPNSKGAQS